MPVLVINLKGLQNCESIVLILLQEFVEYILLYRLQNGVGFILELTISSSLHNSSPDAEHESIDIPPDIDQKH